ncbi:unnamed protein product [Boreogadus saida]
MVELNFMVGDQILEVNGRSFLGIPHDDAVRVLKSSRHLMMTVKDVGRLPHARTVVGETKWIASSQISETSTTSSLAGVSMDQGASAAGKHLLLHLITYKPSEHRHHFILREREDRFGPIPLSD